MADEPVVNGVVTQGTAAASPAGDSTPPDDQNDVQWERLLEYVESDRVIPIVGPDLLMIERSPGQSIHYYADLVSQVTKNLAIPASTTPLGLDGPGQDLSALYYRYMSSRRVGLRVDTLYGELFRAARNNRPSQVPAALTQLAEISKLKLFVTTTFDSLLERALTSSRGTVPEVRVFSLEKNTSQDLRTPLADGPDAVIYHLFGKFSARPGSYAMTQGDLLEFIYKLQANKPEILFRELADHCLLVLGSQFSGWLARFFLRLAKGDRISSGTPTPTFVADRYIADEPNTVLLINLFQQEIIVFEKIGPIEFVSELHRRWAEWEKNKKPVTPRTPADDLPFVFISYASEDRPALERIVKALADAGVTCFFDEHALQGGQNWDSIIRGRIEKCHLFMPILSDSSLGTSTDRYFRFEWTKGLEKHDRTSWWTDLDEDAFLLPVAINKIDKADRRVPEKFKNRQWFDLTRVIPGDDL